MWLYPKGYVRNRAMGAHMPFLNLYWKTQASLGRTNHKCRVNTTTNGSDLDHPVRLGQCGWSCFLRTAKAIVNTAGKQLLQILWARHIFTLVFWDAETCRSFEDCCKFYITPCTSVAGYTCGTRGAGMLLTSCHLDVLNNGVFEMHSISRHHPSYIPLTSFLSPWTLSALKGFHLAVIFRMTILTQVESRLLN